MKSSIATHERDKGWILPFVAAFLMTVGIAAVVAGFRDTSRAGSVASTEHELRPHDYAELADVAERARHRGGLSESDWTEVKAASRTAGMSGIALSSLVYESEGSVHHSEAVALLRAHLEEREPRGNATLVVALRQLGDPLWEQAAADLLRSKDQDTRRAASRLFGNSLRHGSRLEPCSPGSICRE